MKEVKSDAHVALVISIQKVCSAYECIFSEIDQYYHKIDFEMNKRSLITALLSELPLPTNLKDDLILQIDRVWSPLPNSEEILGIGRANDKLYIIKFLEKLNHEMESERDLSTSIFECGLHIFNMITNQFIKNELCKESQEKLSKILSIVGTNLSACNGNGYTDNVGSKSSDGKEETSSKKCHGYMFQRQKKINKTINKERLIAEFNDGTSYKDCAKIFNCSYSTIAYYARIFGFSHPKSKSALTKEVLEYNLMKMTPAQCAAKLGYDKTYLYQSMKRFGLKSNIRRSSNDIDKTILNLIRNFPGICAEDLVDRSISERGVVSKSINRMIEKGLIQFGYAITCTHTSEILKLNNNQIYNIIKNNPGISARDISIKMNKSKEHILIFINKLISQKFVQIGYIIGNSSEIQVDNQDTVDDQISIKQESEICKLILNDSSDWTKKGETHSREGNFKEAIECYNLALDINPMSLDAWHNRGFALLHSSEYDHAIKCFNKVIEINPEYALAWHCMGIAFFALGHNVEALKCYNNAIKIDPSQALFWQRRGYVQYKMEYYGDAIKSYDMAIEEDPRCANAWYNMGVILKKLGYYIEAHDAYAKAINIDEYNSKYWNNMGVVLKNMGRYEEALACYEKALKLDHKSVFVFNNSGNAFFGLGRYEESIENYNKAIMIDPNNITILYNKAISLIRLNKIEEAIELYNIIIIKNPNFIRAWIGIGLAYKRLSQHNKAIDCFDKAIGLEPSLGKLWCYKGNVLNALENFAEANRCFTRAIELNPEFTDAWNGSGLALAGLGRYIDARRAFLKAMSLGSL